MTKELLDSIANIFMRVLPKHEPVVLMHVVACDICDNSDRGTKEELKARGWQFTPNGEEFCRRHQ